MEIKKKKKILVISDNDYIYEQVRHFFDDKVNEDLDVHYGFTYSNKKFTGREDKDILSINLKKNWQEYLSYDLILSAHSKQLFPEKLVEEVLCINIHPGYNPYSRGWYPQVFSIINKKRLGATIHIMDNQLDHGPIIIQEEVVINSWDTSLSLYRKILKLEMKLFKENIMNIISGEYNTRMPKEEGDINFKKDFDKLCLLDLEKRDTYQNFIDHLRALSHGEFKNAYFIDEKGNRVYVKLVLKKE